MRAYLYLNTMLLKVTKLKNEHTVAFVTSGTVTAALKDRATQAAITGGGIALNYQGPDGRWNGLFPSDVIVTLGQVLDCILTIDGGNALSRGQVTVLCDVRAREVQ